MQQANQEEQKYELHVSYQFRFMEQDHIRVRPTDDNAITVSKATIHLLARHTFELPPHHIANT